MIQYEFKEQKGEDHQFDDDQIANLVLTPF